MGVKNSDFIITTPENYYLSSRGAFKAMAFRIGNRAFPFEQFDIKYNRPDLVLKKIGQASQRLIQIYHKAYQKRLQKMNFTPQMLTHMSHVPEIKIIPDDIPTVKQERVPVATAKKTLRFKVKAWDKRSLLDRINVYINEVPIYGRNGIDVRDQNSRNVTQQIELKLSSGRNKIEVSALNRQGVESLRETLEITNTGKLPKSHLYVVAIGVSQYLKSEYNLRYAAKDAQDIAAFFENNIDRTHVLKILDHKATRDNILKAKAFFNKSTVDDQVILFFSGHGVLDKNMNYYFGTTDIRFAAPSKKGLSYEAMETILDDIPARKKLLLIDTCHSGEVEKVPTKLTLAQNVTAQFFKGPFLPKRKDILGLSNSFSLLEELFVDLRRGSATVVIASASGASFALESDKWKNGVFTYAILEGLKAKKADYNQDRKVLASELKDYVIKKVQKLTVGQQVPTSRRQSLEFDFKVY